MRYIVITKNLGIIVLNSLVLYNSFALANCCFFMSLPRQRAVHLQFPVEYAFGKTMSWCDVKLPGKKR